MDTRTPKERLRFFYEEFLGISQAAFEQHMGKKGYVKTYSGNPRTRHRALLENTYPSLNLNWVNTGEGEMIKDEYKDNPYVIRKSNAQKVNVITQESIPDEVSLHKEMEEMKARQSRTEAIVDLLLQKIHDLSKKC